MLISNFLSLSSVQVANYILPLVTVPYLVRVLGPEKFGLIAFSQAFIQYFVLISDYGFNLSVTRKISIHRNDKKRVSEIFSSVMMIKAILMFLSFLVLCLLVFNIPRFKTEWAVYLLTFGTVVGNVLFPIWLFQGLERMKQIALLNALPKAIFTVSIFIFIRSESDYVYIPLINSLGFIISGLLGLWIVIGKLGFGLSLPTVRQLKDELEEGWHMFISTVAISLYTISNTFILGLFTNNTIVGYFSAGQLIAKAMAGLIYPLSQTIYPHISRLAQESWEVALIFIRKIVMIVGGSTFALSLLLLIFAPQISNMVFGRQFNESIAVIRILSFLPFIIGIGSLLGVQVMLTFGLKEAYSRIFMLGGAINLFLAMALVVPLKHLGVAFSVLLTEIFVTSSMFVYLSLKGIHVIKLRRGEG